jgi:hypothetical protein
MASQVFAASINKDKLYFLQNIDVFALKVLATVVSSDF